MYILARATLGQALIVVFCGAKWYTPDHPTPFLFLRTGLKSQAAGDLRKRLKIALGLEEGGFFFARNLADYLAKLRGF